VIRIEYHAEEVLRGLEIGKTQLKTSLFAGLFRATALARESVIENIKGGMRKGLGWPPFTPSTIARKAKRGRSLQGLVDTGRMMGAVHENVSQSKLEGYVYPGVDYHKYHEMGTRKMPARETFAPVPKQINQKIEEVFKEEIYRAVGM